MEETKQLEALRQLKSLSQEQKNLPEVINQQDLIQRQQSLKGEISLGKRQELSEADTQPERSKAQKYIQEVLVDKYNYGPEQILREMVEIAQSGMLPNPITGEMEYSHKIQMEMKKTLMEMMGYYKNKKQEGNTFNLTKIIYGQGMNNNSVF